MKSDSTRKLCDGAFDLLIGGHIHQAFKAFEMLAHRRPKNARVLLGYASSALKLGAREFGERIMDQAQILAHNDGDLLLQIGHQYASSRMPGKARVCFEQSILARPRTVNPRIALAEFLEKNHHSSEARAVLEDCLRRHPRDEQARYLSALFARHDGTLERAEGILRDLLATEPRHQYVRYACRFELANIFDRMGRFDEAMDALIEAKRLLRMLIPNEELLAAEYQKWLVPSVRERMQPKSALTVWAKYFHSKKRCPIGPVALLGGHPRSGTTLLEQIIGAHSHIASIDEPPTFLKDIFPRLTSLASPSISDLNGLRKAYVDGLRREGCATKRHQLLLDKNPSATVHLGAMLKLMPELRVIISLRDPRDVIISCFFQNVPLNPISIHFLSIDGLAKHYSDVMGTWLAIRRRKGFAWTETKYENIVTDLEQEGRRITSFLGMKWQATQKRFYEATVNSRHYSPSYNDVTKPIYMRSVNRWRNYEKYLIPIMPALEPFCRAFGYAN